MDMRGMTFSHYIRIRSEKKCGLTFWGSCYPVIFYIIVLQDLFKFPGSVLVLRRRVNFNFIHFKTNLEDNVCVVERQDFISTYLHGDPKPSWSFCWYRYRKSSIESRPCIILNPKFPRLVLESVTLKNMTVIADIFYMW